MHVYRDECGVRIQGKVNDQSNGQGKKVAHPMGTERTHPSVRKKSLRLRNDDGAHRHVAVFSLEGGQG